MNKTPNPFDLSNANPVEIILQLIESLIEINNDMDSSKNTSELRSVSFNKYYRKCFTLQSQNLSSLNINKQNPMKRLIAPSNLSKTCGGERGCKFNNNKYRLLYEKCKEAEITSSITRCIKSVRI